MTWELLEAQIAAYLLVFCRVGGMLFLNPVFSRRNIPGTVRAALALGLSLILAPVVGGSLPAAYGDTFALILMMSRELMMGAACAIAFQFFYYMLFFAGDVVDMGFGLSMAKVFDPGSSLQISLSGNLFQFLFILYFFTTDSHLLFIKLIASSYDVVAIGAAGITGELGAFGVTLFLTAFNLTVRLILPFLAASFVLELSMGILMKLIPQINVFVIHFQLKIFLGLGLMFLFAAPVAAFMEQYVNTVMHSINDLLGAFALR